MKVKTSNHIILFLMLCSFCFCKKERQTDNNHSGIVFYQTNTLLNGFRYNGLSINNSSISFTGQQFLTNSNNLTYDHVDGLFTYNIHTQHVTENRNTNKDTSKAIMGTINIGPNKYIGCMFNHHTYKLYNGMQNYPLYLLLLDGSFNILKELELPAGTLYQPNSFLKDLGNGTYLFTYCVANYFSQNYMVCVDDNLDIKWEKRIESTNNPLSDYTIKDILINNESIYILQNKVTGNTSDDHYRIKQYDLNGNYLSTSPHSVKGMEGKYISPSTDGFAVLSTSNSIITDFKHEITKFNSTNNLVQTKTIVENIFNNNIAFSNLLGCNNSFYFVSSGGLVKLNSEMEIEWVKPIGNPNKSVITITNTQARYDQICLMNVGNNIIYIAKDNWDGVSGFTFVKMDLEGNLVK